MLEWRGRERGAAAVAQWAIMAGTHPPLSHLCANEATARSVPPLLATPVGRSTAASPPKAAHDQTISTA